MDACGFRKGDWADGSGTSPQRPQRLVLSSSSFTHLPEGASFRWVGIEARSLAEHPAYLQQLKEAMPRDARSPALAQASLQNEKPTRTPYLLSRRRKKSMQCMH